MSRLAIKGHKTRGAEVIAALEMLGYINKHNYSGDCDCLYFYGGSSTGIIYYDWVNVNTCYKEIDTLVFTLEEFEEKFPYKVGDKVIYEDKRREITKMVWEESTNTVAYKLDDKLYCNVIDALQPYKEETMEEKLMPRIDLTGYCKDKYIIALGNYKIQEENGVTYAIRKKPQYPKTYKECCDVLGLSTMDNDAKGYKGDLIIRFQELLIARDAYWKIACEQMGLGKSWEPDYKNPDIDLYVIINIYNRAEKATYGYGFQQCILTFPTKEMRDAFYENFKELIKECISLL